MKVSKTEKLFTLKVTKSLNVFKKLLKFQKGYQLFKKASCKLMDVMNASFRKKHIHTTTVSCTVATTLNNSMKLPPPSMSKLSRST